ncbi:MAG: anthranilate phosphoribosyltransferase [Anaerolineae bacterium CG_4_9_14_3_um_filter_57_17]|nr:anthranilate phosphoribosyltransferase [bacterium]NCT19557.1 anthranilate phosphoribosyltransferase [bacterium]OIO85877.1 MAG: anthranilate phosphoribosyltransferase [Anaerolineae bacterium CG2_30_57_67]PJB66440.1 MAG: anthranilate phosphoribosyltransferase [Anaerolineae bacterium CG_4_9_14_3_um_filter_57_17]
MLALIDNYDSFTYNLVQYFGELGAEIRVFRNDQISLNELIALKPDHLVISPGPGEPLQDGGISPEAMKHFTGKIPVLGVCLGHQCLGAIYGGKVERAPRLMHGKTSPVSHNGQGIFKDVPSPFDAMRYHSLIVYEPVPAELEIIAQTAEGEIMGLKHKQHPTYGVQFHPESILTEHGKQILKNFLDIKPAQPMTTEPVLLKPFIAKVINRADLSAEEAEQALSVIMTGGATPAQIGAYLIALRMKGETIAEVVGSVRAMRAASVKVKLEAGGEPVYDIVGTGGDGTHTFNISTAAAFVVAGAGRKVAKHGNRAASSQCGSADVLSALGVNLDLTPEQVATAIQQVGIGFMFAPKFHPAMKYAVGPRKEIGQRTIFNILGPLTNPAGANIQLTGVYDASLTEPLAHVLQELGSRAALVIYGANGLDELNPTGVNRVSHLKNGNVTTYDLNPADFGLAPCTVADLRGGAPDQSAAMMRDLLGGKLRGAIRDAVLLNAAAALAAETGDFKSALQESESSLNSGAALDKLNALIEFSHSVS